MGDAPTDGRRPRPRPRPAPTPEPALPVSSVSSAPATPRPNRSERRQAEKRSDPRSRQRRLRLIMVGATIVAVLAGGASVIVALTRPDGAKPATPNGSALPAAGAQFADADVASAFLAAATADVTAVTTYDYRRLDDALSAGLAVTTGGYRTAYRQALTGALADSARADRVVHDFQVLDTGIGAITDDNRQAKVLVFGRQVTTDRRSTDGSRVSLVTLCATIRRTGDRYLISDLAQDSSPGVPPGSPDLAAAAEAARSEVVNLLTYSRVQFAADLRRALAGAVDPLKARLQREARANRTAMTKGGYDLRGAVSALAVKSANGSSAALLVAADASKVGDSGAVTGVTPMRYVVTVTKTSGTWAAAQVDTLTSR